MSLAQTKYATVTILTVTNVNMSYQSSLTGKHNIMFTNVKSYKKTTHKLLSHATMN